MPHNSHKPPYFKLKWFLLKHGDANQMIGLMGSASAPSFQQWERENEMVSTEPNFEFFFSLLFDYCFCYFFSWQFFVFFFWKNVFKHLNNKNDKFCLNKFSVFQAANKDLLNGSSVFLIMSRTLIFRYLKFKNIFVQNAIMGIIFLESIKMLFFFFFF